jgi:hypothetical protein
MTSHQNGRKEDAAEMLIALLADVSEQMIIIGDELRKKPSVKSVSRGCDVRKYRDAFRFDDKPFYDFEAWVETEMEGGSALSWLVDINCTPAGWEMQRVIVRSPEDDVTWIFSVVSSPTFLEFAGKVADAMENFLEAARSYDFRDS